MLRASREQLHTELVVNLQRVREKELNFFLHNIISMAQVLRMDTIWIPQLDL